MYNLMLWFSYYDGQKDLFIGPAFCILRSYDGAWNNTGFSYAQLPSVSLSEAEDVLEKLKGLGFSVGPTVIHELKFKLVKNAETKLETFMKDDLVYRGSFVFG